MKKRIAEPPFCDTPNWETFRKPLEKWINNKKDSKWLGNARFLAFNTTKNILLHKRSPNISNTLDLDKLVGAKRASLIEKEATSPLSKSEQCSPDISLAGTKSTSVNQNNSCVLGQSSPSKTNHSSVLNNSLNITWPYDIQKIEGLEPYSPELNNSNYSLELEQNNSRLSNQSRRLSGAEELKKFLRKELAFPEHPVFELVEQFKLTYEALFFKNKISDARVLISKEEEQKMTDEALLPVKRIIHLLREFTALIYKDVIAEYATELSDEDQDADIIIDQLICQLVFDDTQTLLYQHITKCLQNRCKEHIKYFSHVAESFRGKCLHQFDLQFKEKFMQLDSRVPYETVIKTVHLLKMIPNPYMKKDYISTMEQEMIYSIIAELSKKGLAEEVVLEPDDKFTIYTYCLVHSQYSNIVVDISFIEEFTLPCETNQAYARFKGCLMDYILSTDFLNYMKIEEEKRALSPDNKSTKKCCSH